MFLNSVGTVIVAFGSYHLGPIHPGYNWSASGQIILAGTSICTESMMSLSMHVGIIGMHTGESPYASQRAMNGIKYHIMSEMPLSPINPVMVAIMRYKMYERKNPIATCL